MCYQYFFFSCTYVLPYLLSLFCFFYFHDQCLKPFMAEDLFQTNPLFWMSCHAGTNEIYAFCVERGERRRIITVNVILAVTDYIILSSNKISCMICPHALTFGKFFCVPGLVKDIPELQGTREPPMHHPVQQYA